MTINETKEWIRQSILEEVIVVKENVLRISIIGNSICRDIHGRKNLWVVSPAPLLSLSSARLSPKLKRIDFHYKYRFIHLYTFVCWNWDDITTHLVKQKHQLMMILCSALSRYSCLNLLYLHYLLLVSNGFLVLDLFARRHGSFFHSWLSYYYDAKIHIVVDPSSEIGKKPLSMLNKDASK